MAPTTAPIYDPNENYMQPTFNNNESDDSIPAYVPPMNNQPSGSQNSGNINSSSPTSANNSNSNNKPS
jgi:hypothetical protein